MKTVLHPLGDFSCTWHIPNDDGTLTNTPGKLALHAGEQPGGDAHGIDLFESADLLPQRRHFEVVTATLASGTSAVLLDVRVESLGPGMAVLTGRAGVISIDPFEDGKVPHAHEMQIQIESLDAISGLVPLIPRTVPSTSWSASKTTASLTWSDEEVSATLDYEVSGSGLDPYAMTVQSRPRLTIKSAKALPLSVWIDEWIVPLRRVCSLAAGRSCAVTYVLLRPAGKHLSQLYADGVTQQDNASSHHDITRRRSGLDLAADDVSLIALARAWRRAEGEHHPIVETYGAMLLVDEHPRSRFLLLLQALEGAYGFEHRQQFDAAQKKSETKLEVLLVKIRQCTNNKDRKQIKQAWKMAHPHLEEVLTATLASLPFDILPWFENSMLLKRVGLNEQTGVVNIVAALRIIRNDLAHGNRGYDEGELRGVVKLLERVVRAETLRILGCPEQSVIRVLKGG